MLASIAVKKSREFVNVAKASGKLNSRFYEYSFTYIYNEYLKFLRHELILSSGQFTIVQFVKNYAHRKYLSLISLFSNQSVGVFDIVFFGSYSTHYNMYEELEVELVKRGFSCLYLTDKIKLYREIKLSGRRVVFINSGLNLRVKTEFDVKKIDEQCFMDLLTKSIENNQQSFIRFEGELNRLLKVCSPKVVITGNELLTEHRIALLIARKLDIKSVTLQHGLISFGSKSYGELLADLILVYGYKSKEILTDLGVSEGRIEIVGPIGKKIALGEREEVLKREKCHIVLVVFSGFGNSTSYEHHILLIEAIGVVSKKFPNLIFKVKLHLKDKVELYKKIIGPNVMLVTEETLALSKKKFVDLVQESSLVVSTVSAGIFDAFLFNKAVIGMDFKSEFEQNEFYSQSLVLIARNVLDLQKNIKLCIESEEVVSKYQEKATKYIHNYYNIGFSNVSPCESAVTCIQKLKLQ
jgi:hypothetical protein